MFRGGITRIPSPDKPARRCCAPTHRRHAGAYRAVTRQDDVRTPREVFAMETETKARTVENRAGGDLRGGIPWLHLRHDPAALGPGEYVCHPSVDPAVLATRFVASGMHGSTPSEGGGPLGRKYYVVAGIAIRHTIESREGRIRKLRNCRKNCCLCERRHDQQGTTGQNQCWHFHRTTPVTVVDALHYANRSCATPPAFRGAKKLTPLLPTLSVGRIGGSVDLGYGSSCRLRMTHRSGHV